MKYVGVRLASSSLTGKECLVLGENIMHRISSWDNIKLSYGGRVEMIKLVLVNIQAYWSSSCYLPWKVLKEVESVRVQFMWGGRNEEKKAAKVSWESICSDNGRGVPGLPALQALNSALTMKNLWNI